MEHFLCLLSNQSFFNRCTGHARLGCTPLPSTFNTLAPSPAPTNPSQSSSLTLNFTKPNIFNTTNAKSMDLKFSKETFDISLKSSFMSFAITDNDSVSNKKLGSSLFLTPPLKNLFSRLLRSRRGAMTTVKTSTTSPGNSLAPARPLHQEKVRTPASHTIIN